MKYQDTKQYIQFNTIFMERKIAYVQNHACEKNRRICIPNVTNGYIQIVELEAIIQFSQ